MYDTFWVLHFGGIICDFRCNYYLIALFQTKPELSHHQRTDSNPRQRRHRWQRRCRHLTFEMTSNVPRESDKAEGLRPRRCHRRWHQRRRQCWLLSEFVRKKMATLLSARLKSHFNCHRQPFAAKCQMEIKRFIIIVNVATPLMISEA